MKKIVIMGASSGIGLGCAEALVARGVKVGLAARHLESIKALSDRYPGMVEYMAIDVTKKDAPEKLNKLIGRLGGMDIYFHVAGIGYENTDLDPEREVAIFETNTCGFVRCISAAWRYFRDQGKRSASGRDLGGRHQRHRTPFGIFRLESCLSEMARGAGAADQ